MTDHGSSFSVATTAFVSLAICAIISYGVFYYFKQRLAVIEHSQMEQARILQAIISRGLAQGQPGQPGQGLAQKQVQPAKEITITQSGLIEVSSDDSSDSGSESESDSDSQSSDSESGSESETKVSQGSDESQDKWSIGDEIHQPDGYFEEFTESFKKNIMIDAINIDSSYVVDSITIAATDDNACDSQQKKIISLNKGALVTEHDSDDGDDDDDTSSSSSEDTNVNDNETGHEFELKIGYKPNASAKAVQLNYGNMAVPALRQLAKERGLGGEDGDLQKLKKKDLVQLLQQ